MPQSKKTAPANMSIKSLIEEHSAYCDDPNCEHKARRLAIKDQLTTRAIQDPVGPAAEYATKRNWCLTSVV